ncbi:LPS assembly lipoprotein LptE [Flavobacteriaceae bacterium]|jgi:predicted small secreted protein|nr:LPS assembly lipoprotein LptE [Flavobacteriaceae bacterium]MDB4127466.1 LPS assembly lipoprotein LptE [Flavobacteriaceae bacterium]MDB9912909.1 LPS assembly lipoprotein LptE [Flavobacteriaceae bacterium]
MKKIKIIFALILVSITFYSCGTYSFTGADIDYSTTKTFQVNYFKNDAPIVEPGIGRDFTLKLQDLLLNQTNLDLVNSSGDLIFEGEIIEYYIAPITATSEITAAQNRLTIIINVRFYNTKEELKDFDQRFRFYYDYPGSSQLVGSQKDEAINVIFERITQDIFNTSLANW